MAACRRGERRGRGDCDRPPLAWSIAPKAMRLSSYGCDASRSKQRAFGRKSATELEH